MKAIAAGGVSRVGNRLKLTVLAGALAVGVVSGAGTAQAQAPTAKSCSQGGACKVGDKGPGGGIVFITPGTKGNTTGKYFEAAPPTWNGSDADKYYFQWCSKDISVPGAVGTAIGTGSANTNAILATSACSTSSAAKAARGYAGGGKSDWFLPSKAELNVMYQQRARVGMIDAELDWSSTQFNTKYAWYQDFTGGTQFNNNNKTGTATVRPVRSF